MNIVNNTTDALAYFGTFFEKIKTEVDKRFGTKGDDQIPYDSLTLKYAINSLPCPVSIMMLKVDTEQHAEAESDVYYLVKFDLSEFGKLTADHYGEIDLEDIQNHAELAEHFCLDTEAIKNIKSLQLVYHDIVEPWLWVWLLSQKALQNIDKYVNDFLFFFRFAFNDNIIVRFGKQIDYNDKYSLEKDPILSPFELLEVDETTRVVFNANDPESKRNTLVDLQLSMCDIQLSPKVPGEVKKVFKAAKKLYVYGYFDYYFFTISQHYGLLAIESALRNKYNQMFGEPKGFVNLPEIIKKLFQMNVIREAEKDFYEAAKDLRNSLSHLTRPSILMPSAKVLERFAFMINQVYEDHKYK